MAAPTVGAPWRRCRWKPRRSSGWVRPRWRCSPRCCPGPWRTGRRKLAHDLDRQKKDEDANAEAERILQQYRDPLLDAAHTLQGRLFNIVAQRFLDKSYGEHVDEYERRYARDYTVYAIAEYLCWVEILRRELRFRDLGDVSRNQALLGHLTEIQYAFQRDDIPAQFRVFRGRQRAIAELMMVPTTAAEGPRSECIGYAAFSRRLETDHDFRPWLVPLAEDVARGGGGHGVREPAPGPHPAAAH